MKIMSLTAAGLLSIFCILLISTVGAVTIEITPTQIAPGGTIVADVHGLEDGAYVTITMRSVINTPEPRFSYDISGLVFPICLDKANFTVKNEHVNYNNLLLDCTLSNLPYENMVVIREGYAENGVWNATIDEVGLDDINGTYNTLRMSGTTSPGAQQVISTMHWEGIKEALEDWFAPRNPSNGGTNDFQLYFTINGIQSGSANVIIQVDGTEVASETINIGNPSNADTQKVPLNKQFSVQRTGGYGGLETINRVNPSTVNTGSATLNNRFNTQGTGGSGISRLSASLFRFRGI